MPLHDLIEQPPIAIPHHGGNAQGSQNLANAQGHRSHDEPSDEAVAEIRKQELQKQQETRRQLEDHQLEKMQEQKRQQGQA